MPCQTSRRARNGLSRGDRREVRRPPTPSRPVALPTASRCGPPAYARRRQDHRSAVRHHPDHQTIQARGRRSGELRRFFEWLLARRAVGQASADVHLADLQAYQSKHTAPAWACTRSMSAWAAVLTMLRYQAEQGQAIDSGVFRFRPRSSAPVPTGPSMFLAQKPARRPRGDTKKRAAEERDDKTPNEPFWLHKTGCRLTPWPDAGRGGLPRKGNGVRMP